MEPTPTAVSRHARETEGHAGRVEAARSRLAAAAGRHAGAIVQASSLGVEDQVVTDLIARHGLDIAVATLDTGMLHAETIALAADTERRYGIAIERWRPEPELAAAFVTRHGDDAMRRSIDLRKACCGLRKVEPLGRMLAGRGAWVTGLRREQSAARGEVAFEGVDENGRVKLSPLADWSLADVWHYVARHDVPYNPLHDRFFPSIGCAPCTRAVALGEDPRAGRWWWEDESAKECGLHVAPLRDATEPAPLRDGTGPASRAAA